MHKFEVKLKNGKTDIIEIKSARNIVEAEYLVEKQYDGLYESVNEYNEIVNLLNSLYWSAVATTHQVNSKRGLSKKQMQDEEKVVKRLAKELNFDPEELMKKLRV
jgi:hypothetical protein